MEENQDNPPEAGGQASEEDRHRSIIDFDYRRNYTERVKPSSTYI
tara:strand:- start:118388 stop:118522 length:135 start_codon:yes stop_codon:yes gene_type:complete